MSRVATALIAVAIAAGLAACGNDKTAAPDVSVIPAPKDFRASTYARQGVMIKVPTNWRLVPGEKPQIATVAAGDGQIAVWRFPRKEPLPETPLQLNAAREALIAQIQKRDKSFNVTSSRIIYKPKLKGVEIMGTGMNEGQQRQQRSLHAYAFGGEIVVDAFAPIDQFGRVDKQTLSKVTRSLKVSKPKP